VSRDGIGNKDNKILEAVVRTLQAARRMTWPLRSSRKSNHLFTQHQHLALLVLRQQMDKSYREFSSWLELMGEIRVLLHLDVLPHFTTLQKFALRLDEGLLERLLAELARDAADDRMLVAVDSTGIQPGAATFYYIQTISLRAEREGRMERRQVRRHIKLTILIDVRSLMVLALRCTQGPGPDFRHFVPVLEKARGSGFVPAAILADKGYDSEANRKFARYQLGAETHIPVRKVAHHAADVRGKLRRRQLQVFDASLYRLRCLVEAVHSAIKRTMSGIVRSRRVECQHKELLLRAVAYNARRATALLQCRG